MGQVPLWGPCATVVMHEPVARTTRDLALSDGEALYIVHLDVCMLTYCMSISLFSFLKTSFNNVLIYYTKVRNRKLDSSLQCPERFLGMTNRDAYSVSNINRLHVDIFQFFSLN